VAEQPRIHDSTSELGRRSEGPPPPLSRYARTALAPEEGAREDNPAAVEASPATPIESSQVAQVAAEPEPPVDPVDEDEPEPLLQAEADSTTLAEPELVDSLPPELAMDTAGGEHAALVTLPHDPAEPKRREKLPFWKRIALPRPLVQATQAATGRSPSLEPILARLGALEKQLAANQSATETHLERFEENLTRLWELEEQMALTEVRERLALLEANQEEIADGLHLVGRNVSILAIVLAIAVAATLLGLGLAL
jgi:hypothetical protein